MINKKYVQPFFTCFFGDLKSEIRDQMAAQPFQAVEGRSGVRDFIDSKRLEPFFQ